MKSKTKNILLVILGIILGLLLALGMGYAASASSQTITVEFDHIAHLDAVMDVNLYCDSVLAGTQTTDITPLRWDHYSYVYSISECATLTLEFNGRVNSGLGQKIDDVTLVIDGGANLLLNSTFTDNLNNWDNPDIGVNGIEGGWQHAAPPKNQAKLDVEATGSNAAPGEWYRLRQTITLSTVTSTPTIQPTPTNTPEPTPTFTPTPTPVHQLHVGENTLVCTGDIELVSDNGTTWIVMCME